MDAPRLSVVIPTRHRDGDLATCLEALRPQVGPASAEVIVTDDGSESTARAMIEARFPFVRWTEGPRRGPASNRNHGARQARGELIVFVDDDVVPARDFLARYAASISPDVDVYEGRTTCEAGIRSPLEHSPVNETGGNLWSCNLMVRRSFWESFGGFDEDFPFPHLEDTVFRERLQRAGVRVLFVRDAVVDHPPRRLAPPQTLGRYHESFFVYSYKYAGHAPSKGGFFRDLLRNRVYRVARHPVGRDSVAALVGVLVEGAHVWRHWDEWDRKWRSSKAG
jgi:GT2 family glycosyltransferase